MTTLKQLNELATAQDNGATLECRTDGHWKTYPFDLNKIVTGGSFFRIQQPQIDRTDLAWCGYGVPTKDNCDRYLDYDSIMKTVHAGMNTTLTRNNGYRHLYRRKKPQVQEDDMYICDHADECQNKCDLANPHKAGEFGDVPGILYCDDVDDDVVFIPYVEPVKPKVVPYTLETFPTDKGTLFNIKGCDGYNTILVIRKNALAIAGLAEHGHIISKTYTWKQALEKFVWPDGTPWGVEVTG